MTSVGKSSSGKGKTGFESLDGGRSASTKQFNVLFKEINDFGKWIFEMKRADFETMSAQYPHTPEKTSPFQEDRESGFPALRATPNKNWEGDLPYFDSQYLIEGRILSFSIPADKDDPKKKPARVGWYFKLTKFTSVGDEVKNLTSKKVKAIKPKPSTRRAPVLDEDGDEIPLSDPEY